MPLPNMHDSGTRESFSTGAVRDTAEGKPRPDLISPHANSREGAWLAKGAEKYKERNWEAGINISRCIASLSRHLNAYKLGLTDEDHMAAIRTNAGFILHYEEEIKAGRMDPSIDDMPKYAEQAPYCHDEKFLIPLDGDLYGYDADGGFMLYDQVPDQPYPCPTCGEPVKSAFCPETGTEYLCTECGWTSLDKPVPYSPGDTTFQNMPIVYDRTLDPLICNCCGARMDCPTERCAACGWCVYDCVDPREGNLAMMKGVPSSRPTDLQVFCPLISAAIENIPVSVAPTFYVAGPMRGYENLNFPAFDEATERGRALGYNIISPADLDREHGIDPMTDATVVEHENTLSVADLNVIVRRDTRVIMALQPDRGDGIAVLPGWENSTGATAEVALARWLGLRVVYATDFYTEVN